MPSSRVMDLQLLKDAVLPWAERHMPEAVKKTEQQTGNEAVYRRFLARLITRWHEFDDPAGPSWLLLQESDIRLKLKSPSGRIFEVCGRYAEGEIRVDFAMLILCAKTGSSVDYMLDMINDLDTVMDYSPKTKESAPTPVLIKPKAKPKPEPRPQSTPSIVLELLPREFRDRE